MKKILFGILVILLVSLMTNFVSATAPTASDNTVTTLEDTDYVFKEADFGFNDQDGDEFQSVKITGLESVGDLEFDGTDVTVDQIVSVTDINAGKLVFKPNANENGDNYDSFKFKVIDSNNDESTDEYTMTIDVTPVNDFSIGSITPVSGNPGETVNVEITVNNLESNPVTYNFESSDLRYGSNTISAPVIPSITVDGGSSGTVTFSINIPAVYAGTYQGNITCIDASNANNIVSTGYVDILNVLSKSSMDVKEDSFEIKGQEDKTVTGSFTVKNTGSTVISFDSDITKAITYNPENFTSGTKSISLSFSGLGTSLEPGEEKTVTVTASIPKGMREKTYEGDITVTSLTAGLTDNVKLVLIVQPELCEEGEVGNIDLSIEDPDAGDEFKPGEEMEIEVKVWNNDDDDMDIEVYAFLWDVDESEKVADVTSDAVNIDDGDSEKIKLKLKIPTNDDVDENHNYILYVKAYEEGEEDDHCNEDSVEVEIEREKHDVVITNAKVTPTLASPGETVEFVIDVENIGTTDEDDVVVRVKESELGLDLESDAFDLDEAGDDDSDRTIRLSFKIPDNAIAKTYSIEVGVYDEDGDLYDKSDDAQVWVNLVVSGAALPAKKKVEINVLSIVDKIEPGRSYSIPVKVTNNENTQSTFVVKLTNIDDWAVSGTEKTLTLEPGQSETIYLYLKANEDIGEGKFSATVQISDSLGNIVGEETVTLGSEKKVSLFSKVDSKTVFYTIGYIILIIIAIFFIKLIFSGKKRIKEVRL